MKNRLCLMEGIEGAYFRLQAKHENKRVVVIALNLSMHLNDIHDNIRDRVPTFQLEFLKNFRIMK